MGIRYTNSSKRIHKIIYKRSTNSAHSPLSYVFTVIQIDYKVSAILSVTCISRCISYLYRAINKLLTPAIPNNLICTEITSDNISKLVFAPDDIKVKYET